MRKARAEGAKAARPRRAAASTNVIRQTIDNVKAANEGSDNAEAAGGASASASAGRAANPVPGDDGAALSRIAVSFQARFPAEWEAMRLCPLVHGLEEMARLMKGKG
jgi:hypothetical protein